jgi:hypothetical protein
MPVRGDVLNGILFPNDTSEYLTSVTSNIKSRSQVTERHTPSDDWAVCPGTPPCICCNHPQIAD